MTTEFPLPQDEVNTINANCPCYMVSKSGHVITILKASSEYFKSEYMWFRITDNMLLYTTKKNAVINFPKQSNHCTDKQKAYLLSHYAEFYI